jgi:hypothetical protein
VRPLREVAIQLYSPDLQTKGVCDFGVKQRLKSYLDLRQHTEDILKSDQDDFIFLHLPVPHPPAIWNRLDRNFTLECGSSYVDSLALADRTLGEVMTQLEQSPRWKDTMVVVQGDHSWRVRLWNWLPVWTEEDDQVSRGEFDDRPALLIHDAGQTQPRTDARPLSLLLVHSALEQALHGMPAHD